MTAACFNPGRGRQLYVQKWLTECKLDDSSRDSLRSTPFPSFSFWFRKSDLVHDPLSLHVTLDVDCESATQELTRVAQPAPHPSLTSLPTVQAPLAIWSNAPLATEALTNIKCMVCRYFASSYVQPQGLHALVPSPCATSSTSSNDTPFMLNLARLDALDSIQHGFCDRAQSFGSGRDGDILSFVTDAA